jgi:hypothetical protein
LRAIGGPLDADLATLIEDRLASGANGREHQVFLLSPKKDPATMKMPRAVRYTERGAWTQAHRYTLSTALKHGSETTADLAANGG